MPYTVFIVVSGARTGMGSLVRLATGYPYSHVSVSFDPHLSKMYSFARRRKMEPLVGGFVTEYPSRYLLGGNDVPIRIYSLRVSGAEYRRIVKTVGYLMKHGEEYSYNLFDALGAELGIRCPVRRCYTCIDFVCRLLNLRGINSIRRLEEVLAPSLSFTGYLSEVVSPIDADGGGEAYFDCIPPITIAADTVRAVCLLVGKTFADR